MFSIVRDRYRAISYTFQEPMSYEIWRAGGLGI